MARRRRSKSVKKIEVTYANGSTEQFNFHGKSTSGKSLRVSDENGKTFYLPVKRLQSYEIF